MQEHDQKMVDLCNSFQSTREYVERISMAWDECMFKQSRYGDDSQMSDCVILSLCEMMQTDVFLKSHEVSEIINMLTMGCGDFIYPSQVKKIRDCFCSIYTNLCTYEDTANHIELLRYIIDNGEDEENITTIGNFLNNSDGDALIMIPWGLFYLYKKSSSEEIKAKCLDRLHTVSLSANTELAGEAKMHLGLISKMQQGTGGNQGRFPE